MDKIKYKKKKETKNIFKLFLSTLNNANGTYVFIETSSPRLPSNLNQNIKFSKKKI